MTNRLKTVMDAARILREARSFITDPSRWIKGSLVGASPAAPDWEGNIYNAPRVCSLGAIRRVAAAQYQMTDNERVDYLPGVPMADDILSEVMDGNVANFNDRPESTHADVLAAFDLAIEESCKLVQQEAAKSGEKDSAP